MPYVTASIIVQLLTVVIPRLAELQKEGEAGYAKINQYTRYLTVVLAALQAFGYAVLFQRQDALQANAGRMTLIVVTLTTGTVLLMWIGEQITKRGHRQRHLDPHLRLDPDEPPARRQRLVERRPDGAHLLPADRGRASSPRSSSSRKASAGSRSSTRSGWSGAG